MSEEGYVVHGAHKSNRTAGQRRTSARSKSAPRSSSKYQSEPSERIQVLSSPKRYKVTRLVNFGQKVWWGNQDHMPGYEPTDAAKCATATPRVVDLSTPKQMFQTGVHFNRPEFSYSCGRTSPIWNVKESAINAEASERLGTLAQHKNTHPEYKENKSYFVYSCGRVSPTWDVSKAAQQAEERPHTVSLAKHKTTHKDFLMEQPVIRPISKAAQNAKCSERLDSLARPKHRPDGPFREPRWVVSKSTRLANASARNLELAKAKNLPEGFQYDRDYPIEIAKSAKRAIASSRTTQLAIPIIRATMDHIIFDPDAFLVKETALKAYCPPRLNELSQPLVR